MHLMQRMSAIPVNSDNRPMYNHSSPREIKSADQPYDVILVSQKETEIRSTCSYIRNSDFYAIISLTSLAAGFVTIGGGYLIRNYRINAALNKRLQNMHSEDTHQISQQHQQHQQHQLPSLNQQITGSTED